MTGGAAQIVDKESGMKLAGSSDRRHRTPGSGRALNLPVRRSAMVGGQHDSVGGSPSRSTSLTAAIA